MFVRTTPAWGCPVLQSVTVSVHQGVSRHLPSASTHQVHGQDPRDVQGKHPSPWTKGLGGRVHVCLNRDPATQRGAPGMTDPVQTGHEPLPHEEPPDRPRTHLEEQPSYLILHMEMPMFREVLHEERHVSCQTDRSQERACLPDRDQCLLHCRAIPGRTVPVQMLRGVATRISSPRRERCPACCRTRAACLLQYPSPSQKSSNTSDFLVFPAFRYACTWTIVSSIPAALFSSKGPALFCHPSPRLSHEVTEPVHLHVG